MSWCWRRRWGRVRLLNRLGLAILPLYSILHLQVARSALKSLSSFLASPTTANLSPSSAYLTSLHPSPALPLSPTTPAAFLDPILQLQLISLRAALSVSRLARLVKSGKKWSELSHECVEVSRGVTESFLVRRMLEAVEGSEGLLSRGAGEREKEVLRKLVAFVSLSLLGAQRERSHVYELTFEGHHSTSSTHSKRLSPPSSNSASSHRRRRPSTHQLVSASARSKVFVSSSAFSPNSFCPRWWVWWMRLASAIGSSIVR